MRQIDGPLGDSLVSSAVSRIRVPRRCGQIRRALVGVVQSRGDGAVDGDGAAGEEWSVWRGEEQGGLGDFVGLADGAGRVEVAEVLVAGWIGREPR